MQYVVPLEETPFGITFFEGLDIPLVESIASKGAAASAAAKGLHRIRVGDRLIAVNGRDVSHFSTPHVLALLAEASWKLRRTLAGEEASDSSSVLLKFRAAVPDENPEPGASRTDEDTPEKKDVTHLLHRETSPTTRRDRDNAGQRPPARRPSSASVTSGKTTPDLGGPRAPSASRRGNESVSSVVSSTASRDGDSSVADGKSMEGQLAELEIANRRRADEVAAEKARLERLREERRREENDRAERKRQRRLKEERLAAERERAQRLAEEQARIAEELALEKARLESAADISDAPSDAASSKVSSGAITPPPAATKPVVPALPLTELAPRNVELELERRRQQRRSLVTRDTDPVPVPAAPVVDIAEQRRLKREAEAEARKRKHDLSQVAARAREAAATNAATSAPNVPKHQAPVRRESANSTDAAEDAKAKEQQAEELRRLQRSVLKLEKYILRLTQSVAPQATSDAMSPMYGGSDAASIVSAVDSQAPTPVAHDRLPVRVVSGPILSSNVEYGANLLVPTTLIQSAQGSSVLYSQGMDDRVRKELERLSRNPTPTLFEPAVTSAPPPAQQLVYGVGGPGLVKHAPAQKVRVRQLSEPALRSRSSSPARASGYQPRPVSRGPPSPTHTTISSATTKAARVDTWNRDYIRTRSVSVHVPRRSSTAAPSSTPTPVKYHNFLRRSSSNSEQQRSQARPRQSSVASMDPDVLVKQASRRFGAAGASAARDMVSARSTTPVPNVRRSSKASPPSGWELEESSFEHPIDLENPDHPVLRGESALARDDDEGSSWSGERKRRPSGSSRKSTKQPPSRRTSAESTRSWKPTISTRSTSPKLPAPGAAPVVTLRKIIRATRYAASSHRDDAPSLRDVALKVAEDAFAARAARLKAQKEVEKSAKRDAREKLQALAEQEVSRRQLLAKYPSAHSAAKRADQATGNNHKSITRQRRDLHKSAASSRSSKSAATDDDSVPETSESEEEETNEPAQPPAPVRAVAALVAAETGTPRSTRSTDTKPASVKNAQAAATPPVLRPGDTSKALSTPQAAAEPSSVANAAPSAATGDAKDGSDDEYDEYDEDEGDDELAEEEAPAPIASKLLGKWDDTKKSYDVEFRLTPFGIKFRADQPVPVVELIRPEGAAIACGVIKAGHTMISVNNTTLLGLSLPEAARIVGEAAQKTKESNGTIPCIVRFLKTEVPPQADANHMRPKKAEPAKDEAEPEQKKAGGCCWGKKTASAASP